MQLVLTKRQREILAFLEQFIQRNQYSPSLEEIARGVGLSSLATVHAHLKNLERKKAIGRGWNRSRSIELKNPPRIRRGIVEAPLLGRVAAGSPIEAIEVRETVEIPEEFARGKETFVLRVKGDSMIEEQIRDGDLVVVERRDTADSGETVVALVNGSEATVKKFYRQGRGRVRLQPANATMDPLIVPAKSCSIQGVVIALLRKY